jgi:hypothetical protein
LTGREDPTGNVSLSPNGDPEILNKNPFRIYPDFGSVEILS